MDLKIYHQNHGIGQLTENNMFKISTLQKNIISSSRFFFVLLVVLLIATPAQSASEQRRDIERTPFYDKNAELICGSSSSSSTSIGGGGLTVGGGVYFLGDSIGEGVKSSLEKNLTAAGYKITVNADSGRTITRGGQHLKTSGMEAATADAEVIKGSQAVVIELGTNSENNFKANLDTLVNQIKSTGSQAKIYLVDVAASPADAARIGAANTNKIIYAKAAELGTPVISRFKIYYPGGNPETYENATNPTMPFDSLGVHSATSQGYEALSGVIQTTITQASTLATPSTSSPCQCPVSGGAASTSATTTLAGNDNVEMAFNYFISKGFTPQQSAGIIGNLQAESGVNPKRVQSTPSPEGDRDNITVNNVTGYGIAQWTSSGRQQGLVDLARARGMSIEGDLALQLDYLMQELTVGYKAVYEAIKIAPDLRTASDIFMTKFERPRNQSESAKQGRAGMGQKVLELYGASAGLSGSIISGATNCNTGAGGVATGFVGFPLQTTKARMTELNGGQFRDGVMGKGGHPYAAHDIMADPGTPVVAILSGKVAGVSKDKCPGRLISVWSEQAGVTVAYLHLSIEQTIVKEGDSIAEGQVIGFVGPPAAGCGTPHLHIDANTTNRRIGCKRESCSAENQALFQAGSDKIALPKSLFDSYQRLP